MLSRFSRASLLSLSLVPFPKKRQIVVIYSSLSLPQCVFTHFTVDVAFSKA